MSIENPTYDQRPDKDARLTSLSAEYDEQNQDLKEVLQNQSELYEQKRSAWVSEQMNLDVEEEELNRALEESKAAARESETTLATLADENERLGADVEGVSELLDNSITEQARIGQDFDYLSEAHEEKIQEAKYDAVTGLESRRAFFTRMDNAIRATFKIPEGVTLSNEDWLKILNDEKSQEKSRELYLAFGDVSFLTLANRGGRHSEGDAMLLNTARATNQALPNLARLSGDEFAAIVVGSAEEVKAKASQARTLVAGQEQVSNLKDNNLVANIDIGLASFAEALAVYKKLRDSGYERRGEPENIAHDLKDIWKNIADKRSSIDKIRDRLNLLLTRKAQGERFLGELTKSVYGLAPELIEDLLTMIEASANRDAVIEDFIKIQEISLLNEIEGEHNKAQVREILSLLDII